MPRYPWQLLVRVGSHVEHRLYDKALFQQATALQLAHHAPRRGLDSLLHLKSTPEKGAFAS